MSKVTLLQDVTIINNAIVSDRVDSAQMQITANLVSETVPNTDSNSTEKQSADSVTASAIKPVMPPGEMVTNDVKNYDPEVMPISVSNATALPQVYIFELLAQVKFAYVWSAGVLIGGFMLLVSVLKTHRLFGAAMIPDNTTWQKAAECVSGQIGLHRYVLVLCHPKAQVPFVAGYFRPTLFVPNDYEKWNSSQRGAILLHELTHIQRNDIAWHLITRIAAVIYWFQPLIWLVSWRMQIEREAACDDAVLLHGEVPSNYASVLLDIVSSLKKCRKPICSAISMARNSSIERRIISILRTNQNRTPIGRKTSGLFAVLASLLVVFLTVVSPFESPKLLAINKLEVSAPDVAQENTPQNVNLSNENISSGILITGDAESEETKMVSIKTSKDLLAEMLDNIAERTQNPELDARFSLREKYVVKHLDDTKDKVTGNELNGWNRLTWYEELYRNQLESVLETEAFSADLIKRISYENPSMTDLISTMKCKLDVATYEEFDTFPVTDLEKFKSRITVVRRLFDTAIEPLTPTEKETLQSGLYQVFCENEKHGHTVTDHDNAKKLFELMDKIDHVQLFYAAEHFGLLADDRFIEYVKQLPETIQGTVRKKYGDNDMQVIETEAGEILIGGVENNVYKLNDQIYQNVVAIIDRGGNDTYLDGTCDLNRPVFVIIDIGGDDTYYGSHAGVQGGSILGLSMLIDVAGNDTYAAKDIAQGSSIGGVGILIDQNGNDKY
ncbi:MAG: M56 family metallopeptidase, partial [Thermoguttaceae bacterium]